MANLFIPDLVAKLALLRSVLPVDAGDAAVYANLYEAAESANEHDSGSVPHWVPEAILTLFPGVTQDFLQRPLAEFKKKLRLHQAGIKRVREADRLLQVQQPALTKWIREYYAEENYGDEFPLVTQEGWILDEPVLLNAQFERELLAWSSSAARPLVHPVAGTNVRFHVLREFFNPGFRFKGGPSYRLRGVTRTGSIPRLTFSLGDYLDYFDTCVGIGLETAELYSTSNGEPYQAPSSSLRGSPSSAFEFEKRVAVPGINTLCVLLNHQRGDVFFYHKRGTRVADAQNMVAIIPAGSFEPTAPGDAWHGVEFSLLRNIFREFAEELLNQESNLFDNDGKFKSGSGVQPLIDAVHDGSARMYYFGLGLDPLSLRPEILTCLVLDMRTFQRNGVNLAFVSSTFEGVAELERFGPEQLRNMAARKDVVAGSATCMLLAALHYGRLAHGIGRKVK